MISKNQSKLIRALHTKKARQAEGLFLVEGRKALQEIAGHPDWQVHSYVLAEDAYGDWATKVRTIAGPGQLIVVKSEELADLTTLQTNTEGLAVVASPALPPFTPEPGRLYLALDGIRDPGNLGTLLRLADWFGITDVLCSDDTCEWQNPKTVMATMGSFLRVRVHYGALAELLRGLPAVYGALLEGQSSYALSGPMQGALLIGSESHGIRPETLPLITHPITIPRFGEAESLNAAMAAGMLLYEGRRG